MAKTLKQFLVPQLRRISLRWSARNEALNAAKVLIDEGKFKNGKVKTRVYFECAHCAKEGLDGYYKREEVQVDHIHPIANLEGFKDWNSYIPALFCDKEKLQVLCEYHHDLKTLREKEIRLDKSKK